MSLPFYVFVLFLFSFYKTEPKLKLASLKPLSLSLYTGLFSLAAFVLLNSFSLYFFSNVFIFLLNYLFVGLFLYLYLSLFLSLFLSAFFLPLSSSIFCSHLPPPPPFCLFAIHTLSHFLSVYSTTHIIPLPRCADWPISLSLLYSFPIHPVYLLL